MCLYHGVEKQNRDIRYARNLNEVIASTIFLNIPSRFSLLKLVSQKGILIKEAVFSNLAHYCVKEAISYDYLHSEI